MKTREDMTDSVLWRDKAVAFAARSRQELWGKHNEDIMAWFFLNGFKNRFIKDKLLAYTVMQKGAGWGADLVELLGRCVQDLTPLERHAARALAVDRGQAHRRLAVGDARRVALGLRKLRGAGGGRLHEP